MTGETLAVRNHPVRPFRAFAALALALAAVLACLSSVPGMADPNFFKTVKKDSLAEAGRLLKQGVPSNIRTASLYHAVSGDMVRLLARSGVDTEAVIREERKALHWAAERGRIGVAKALLEIGADIEGRSQRVWNTPLMAAARSSRTETARMLIDAGADVNAGNVVSFTPLHWAAKYSSDPEMIHLLLDADADPLARETYFEHPDDGFTPLDVMAKYNPRILNTAAGKRLFLATRTPGLNEDGCDGVVVQSGEKKLSWISRRIYGTDDRWREIRDLNGLEGKSYRIGDCRRLPGMPDL